MKPICFVQLSPKHGWSAAVYILQKMQMRLPHWEIMIVPCIKDTSDAFYYLEESNFVGTDHDSLLIMLDNSLN